MTNNPKALASLKPDTPFNHLFPGDKVPIKSIQPVTNGEDNFYIVDAEYLGTSQVEGLANILYQLWQPKCESIDQAIEYIEEGLPIKADWFTGVETSDFSQVAPFIL